MYYRQNMASVFVTSNINISNTKNKYDAPDEFDFHSKKRLNAHDCSWYTNTITVFESLKGSLRHTIYEFQNLFVVSLLYEISKKFKFFMNSLVTNKMSHVNRNRKKGKNPLIWLWEFFPWLQNCLYFYFNSSTFGYS